MMSVLTAVAEFTASFIKKPDFFMRFIMEVFIIALNPCDVLQFICVTQ